jgi:hypothetical protein
MVPDGTSRHKYPQAETPAHQAWREAVAVVAAKAKQTLPQCNGRVEKAVAIVLAGDVEFLPDGTAKVASQSHGTTQYFVVNGMCSCKDFPKAPQGFCKHRLSYAIAKRVTTLAKAKLAQLDQPTHQEAPQAALGTADDTGVSPKEAKAAIASVGIPAQFLVELHGKQFVTYGGLLAMAHEKGLVKLAARFISVDAKLALAEATAEFKDGRTFQECADSTPENVNARIRPHFPRLALTRAKARTLRDALNLSMVCVDELEG